MSRRDLQEVELNLVTNLGNNILRLKVETAVLNGGSGSDAVDDSGGADTDRRGGRSKADDSSSNDGGEGNHFD